MSNVRLTLNSQPSRLFRNRLYYRLKPLFPPGFRLGVRRWFALRQRDRVWDVWPILPGSEKPPAGWPGWPEGKQFAFVLTHDVEGSEGLEKVKSLAELEMSLGFRSCFNFIPEGPYRVPAELRAWLTANGFEVGVHDLRHDGNLFRNRQRFSDNASRINKHLQAWGAVGFRAGFMLHQLDWLHDLNIQYDCSTFDTDPFEPQPHGQHTIFPFWVACPEDRRPKTEDSGRSSALRPPSSASSSQLSAVPASQSAASGQWSVVNSTGYVELPYTLPQDSTLFLLLREKTPALWLQKLDWIAQHGGMALVNVHPDYVRFNGEASSPRTYPVEHYVALLQHARAVSDYPSSVAGRPISDLQSSICSSAPPSATGLSSVLLASGGCWHASPRQVAAFAAPLQLPPGPKPKRICMVTHSFYESDNRVVRYAEALAARGDQVDVLALQRSPETPREETISGVRVVRLQSRFGKKEQNHLEFLLPVLRFGASSWWWITWHHLRNRRYELFHIHNIPDFLVFTAWVPRLTGTPVLLDIHDLVPEFYASKFGVRKSRLVLPLLRWMERLSAAFAHHIIIANDLWVQRYAARTGASRKCSVFINHVDGHIFHHRPRTRNDDKLIVLFPGGLQWHQGLDIALRAFQQVRVQLPAAEFHIYGDGNVKDQLVQLAAELGLNGSVRFFEPLRVRQIAEVMANADLGVVPKRADSFGNEAYSTKIMEFMSLGVPVVVSETKIDRYYFNDSIVRFFESGNPTAMAEAMLVVLGDRPKSQQMVSRARAYAAQNSWETRQGDYLSLVDSVCSS